MYDVVIVGACTAGTYFAGLLATRGLKVLVIDRDTEETLAKRLDIIHFTRDSYAQFGVEPCNEGDPEFVRNFHVCYGKSTLNNHLKTNYINVSVLHLPLFIQRLRKTALKKHYMAYPETPDGYPAWEKKALKLWKKAGSMADTVKDP